MSTIFDTVLRKDTERYRCTKINKPFLSVFVSAEKGVGEKTLLAIIIL